MKTSYVTNNARTVWGKFSETQRRDTLAEYSKNSETEVQTDLLCHQTFDELLGYNNIREYTFVKSVAWIHFQTIDIK